MPTTNTSNADRLVRVVIGAALIALGFYARSIWGLIGFVPLVTGIFGYCPIYSLLGIKTSDKPASPKPRARGSQGA